MLTSLPSRSKFFNGVSEFVELNKKRSLRQKIHSLMFLDQFSGKLHHIFDVSMMVVIFVAVVIVIFESVETIRFQYLSSFRIAEIIISLIFITEYVCRIFSIVEKKNILGLYLGELNIV